jgi:hypothetical protein
MSLYGLEKTWHRREHYLIMDSIIQLGGAKISRLIAILLHVVTNLITIVTGYYIV